MYRYSKTMKILQMAEQECDKLWLEASQNIHLALIEKRLVSSTCYIVLLFIGTSRLTFDVKFSKATKNSKFENESFQTKAKTKRSILSMYFA